MLSAFENHLQKQFPQLYHSKLLVAISGGVDSVVLTHLCGHSKLDVALAHCNFHLRDEESDGDESFVVELADALDLKVFVEHFDTLAFAEEHKLSVQVAARELRYAWFEELRESLGFDYVLTAHHANDNLETFLINLIRGTGLDGLSGIPKRNGFVLRPLLPFSRQEIEEFATAQNLSWREDSSNTSDKYLRNRIRQQVVPLLEELNPQFLESFSKTQSHLKKSSHLVDDYVSAVLPRVAKEHPYGYTFDINILKSLPHLKAVLYEMFKSFGFKEWDDVYRLLDAQSGKMVLSKTHRLIKDREVLILTELTGKEDYEYLISEQEEVVMLPMGMFHFEKAEQLSEIDKNSIFVDKSKINFPLLVRKWREGDFFHPFGMEGKKKLSKFLKDCKVPVPEKENTWVLCSEERILWVIGRRADARFQIDATTNDILKITYLL